MLTGRGRGALAVSAVLYGAGVALGYVELLVLATGGVLAVVAGAGWMVRNPALGVDRRLEPTRVERGAVAKAVVTFTNTGRLASSAVTAVDRAGRRGLPVEVARLAPGASAVAEYPLPTGRRMAVDVGPIDVTREDPLGLWRRVRSAGDVRRLWVHPVAQPLLALPPGRTRSLDGTTDHVPHGSITFHALREYVPGDDLRLVHWRSFARTRTLLVRENVDASIPRLTLLVDDRAGVFDADGFEEAMDVAASVVVAAVRSGFPIRLVTAGGRAVGGRAAAGGSLLDALAELEPVTGADLRAVVARLSLEGHSDTVVVVSGRPTPEDLGAFGALARRYDDAVVALVGRGTESLQVPGGMAALLLRGETADELVARWNRSLR
jgi:uncharacterized protein (DUF58 family)